MIEELTPQVLMSTMVLVILVSSALTLVISALLMWRYRCSVARAMAATAGFDAPAAPAGRAESPVSGTGEGRGPAGDAVGSALFRRALRAPWQNAARYAVAGLAFAVVLAAAPTEVYPSGLGLPGFVIAVWIYAWPVVLALPLIVPGPLRFAAAGVAAYFAVYALLGLWAGTVTNLPEFRFGAVVVPARSTVTPAGMLRLRLAVNGGPTLLALFSPRGVEAAVTDSESLGIHVSWLVVATWALSLGAFGNLGSVQLITGPDLAHSTVQPHQFLDFLSGGLSRHFVRDRASLAGRLAERDLAPDPDGRFRINSFFCHADAWQAALPGLVGERDIVLMDLRSFSAANAGCIHELRYLVQEVPFDRCVLVIDDTTDAHFLARTLQEAAARLPAGSPNHGRLATDAPVHRLDAGRAPLEGLLRRLCDAAGRQALQRWRH